MQYKGKTVDKQPTCNWKAVYRDCAKHQQFIVEIREYNEEKEISRQQMKYLHAVIIPLFVDYTGDSPQYWENKLKLECGSKWFKPEIINVNGNPFTIIPSKKIISINNFTEWYQNITDYGLQHGVIVPPPNKDWKLEKYQEKIK